MAESGDLISFIASMSGEGNLRVEENLGSGYVRLRVAEAERRQAKHDIQYVEDIVVEMLRNARDAGADAVFIATVKEERTRTLLFLDNGCGIPAVMHEKVFEPRVTSKLESMRMDRWGVHGRGMALYSIRENASEARVVTSDAGLGSAFRVVVDLDDLRERADQSTWPVAKKNDEGVFACVKGPHNIARAAGEFALEELHTCDVYLGTPTEIAATLYYRAQRTLDRSKLLFVDDEGTLPVVDRLGLAADASDFLRIASGIGLVLSERTAHRILAGAIPPLNSVSARLLREGSAHKDPAPIDLAKDRRGLKIAQDDIADFSRVLERSFAQLGNKYFISLAAEPRVRVRRDRITVTFDIDKGE